MLATRPNARDLMSPDPIVVQEDLTAAEAVELFRDHEISGAPVMDRDGKLVGVISVADLARAGTESAGVVAYDRSNPAFFLRGWEDELNPEDFRRLHLEGEGMRVRDLMTPAAFTVAEDVSAREIAQMMVSSHLHRVLVTRGAEVVGIISSLDLLRLLAEEA